MKSPRILMSCALMCLMVLLDFGMGTAYGQMFSGRGRGTPRGLLRELNNENVRAELELTPEQALELDAILESNRDNREQFADIFQKFAQASSEEERNQVRAEMQARFVEVRKKAEAEAKAILTPAQVMRLEQLYLHLEGPMLFVWEPELATEFGITEEQKKELSGLGEQRMVARLALGRDASPEDRKKLDDEWAEKLLSVLTPEQQKLWNDRSGPAPTVILTSQPRPSDTNGSGTEPQRPTTATSTPAPAASPGMTATGPDSPVPQTDPVPAGTATAGPAPADVPQTPQQTQPPQRIVTLQPPGASNQPGGTFKVDSKEPTDGNSSDKGEKKLSFNFRYAPWSEVLKLFAEELDLSLDLNVIPPGTFNYLDRNEYTPTEALDIINGYLLTKGYCLVRRDDFLVCISIDDPIPPSLIPNVSPDDLESRGKNELLTVIFPLEGVDVTQMAAEVHEIKGPQGKVVGLKSTNSLLVTDIGTNLIRIRDMLKGVTARGGPNDISFRSYPVKHIEVTDAEAIVRALLGVTPSVANVSSSAGGDSPGRGDPRGGFRGGPPGSSRGGERGEGDQRNAQNERGGSPRAENAPVRVAVDTRTNQLLVTATLAQHVLIEQALKTIDVEGDESQFSPSSNRPFLKVYQVTGADTVEVTKTINALMPGVVVNEDARNRKIHIQATPTQHRQVESLIAQMDGLGNRQMAVIPLSRLEPVSVTATIRSLFTKDGEAAPIIEADQYGQQLLIRANPEQLTQIRALLSQLGEDGTPRSARMDNSLARTMSLSGRDPAEIIPLLQKMWSANSDVPIQVINPSAPSRSGPPGPRPGPGSGVKPNADSGASSTPPASRRPAAPPQTSVIPESLDSKSPFRLIPTTSGKKTLFETAWQPGERSETQSESPATTPSEVDQLLDQYLNAPTSPKSDESTPAPTSTASPASAGPSSGMPAGLNIVVMGDELFITSSDPEQLNQFEELLERTLQAIPPRITWTVFTLRVADATEAANMLKLLFPGTSVSASSSSSGGVMDTLSSGVMSLGSSLRDMTGLGALSTTQTLRIIPDVRQNALFVSGPPTQVREVEEMLRIIDATDLGGDSLRNKLARMIPVQYASADEVYNVVKDVFKNYIDPPRPQQVNNPLAMLAGGGGGGGRGGQGQGPAPEPKLALGVDRTTNHLIVWADDALFQEVESLVEAMDQAMLDARRTVRVINLENASSSVVRGALGSVLPQVKVSVTGARSSATTTSSSSTSSSSSTPSSDPDQIRQMFEQRMRERMQGGGGFGSGGFGGRGGFGGGGFGGSRGSGGRGFGGR